MINLRRALLQGLVVGLLGYTLAQMGVSPVAMTIAAVTTLMILFSPVVRRRVSRDVAARKAARDARMVLPDTAGEEFHREFDRSRRFESVFTVMRLIYELENGRSPAPERGAELRKMIRTVDRVWSEDNEVLCLFPETDTAGVRTLLSRVRRRNAYLLPRGAVRIVGFPTDAISVGALLTALNAQPDDEPAGSLATLGSVLRGEPSRDHETAQ